MAVWEYLQKVDEAAPGEISKHAKVARPTVNQVMDKSKEYGQSDLTPDLYGGTPDHLRNGNGKKSNRPEGHGWASNSPSHRH